MSLYSAKSQAIFAGAERASLSPPDDEPDYLEGIPHNRCPWCYSVLFPATDLEIQPHPFCPKIGCLGYHWHADETVAENRIRYVAERLDESETDAKIRRSRGRGDLDY